MKSRIVVLSAVVVGVAVLAHVSAQVADAWAGTWILNLAKSTYQSGLPPKSAISKLEPSNDGWKMSVDGIDGHDRSFHTETIVKFDGNDYGIPSDDDDIMTWAFTRVDDHTFDLVTKVNLSVKSTTRTVISPDGKTRTSTSRGVGWTIVEVYDRK